MARLKRHRPRGRRRRAGRRGQRERRFFRRKPPEPAFLSRNPKLRAFTRTAPVCAGRYTLIRQRSWRYEGGRDRAELRERPTAAERANLHWRERPKGEVGL